MNDYHLIYNRDNAFTATIMYTPVATLQIHRFSDRNVLLPLSVGCFIHQ